MLTKRKGTSHAKEQYQIDIGFFNSNTGYRKTVEFPDY